MSGYHKLLFLAALTVIGGLVVAGCTSSTIESSADPDTLAVPAGSDGLASDAQAASSGADTQAASDTQAADRPAGEVTAVHFCYDMFSGEEFKLDAWVEEIDASGAKLTLSKRVGPMNYTGHSMEGELRLSREKTDELLEILSRYDIEGYSRLRGSGHSSAPSRTLAVFYGERMLDVRFDAAFPETVPPVQDVMYCELYAFFNGIVTAEPGWEEVRSADIPDPRDNPAYGERTVIHMGREVRLVPGTGTDYEDGRGATIDYSGEAWWLIEGFTGTWKISGEDAAYPDRTHESVTLTVGEDGAALLDVDGEQWEGTLPKDRCYRSDIGITFTRGYTRRSVTVELMNDDDYTQLRLYAYPGPIPEEQFDPLDVRVSRGE